MILKTRLSSTDHPSQKRLRDADRMPARAGFTLIEMVGVLAVILVVATVVFTTSIRQMTLVAGQKESASLSDYATALQNSIQRNRYIPGTNTANWSTNLAAELGVDSGTVSTNPYGWRRLLLADPALRIGGAGLPYTQTASGVTTVTNARVMILSSLGLPLPNLTAADFANIWNTPDGTRPTGSTWTGWRGTTDDLRVQRIDLTPLFVHLVLNNYPTNHQGRYSLDRQSPTNTVPASGGLDAYFLRSSVVQLLTETNGMDSEQILNRDSTFFYSQGTWQTSIPPGSADAPAGSAGTAGAALAQTAQFFSSAPGNVNAASGATPSSVATTMNNFMNAYQTWANAGFPASGAAHDTASAAEATMQQAMRDLAHDLESGGCN